jgi:hypothetical protein
VVKLEQGRVPRPSIDSVAKIADALGVQMVDLTMDIPAAPSAALRAELASLGYRDDEIELLAEIVNQVACYWVPPRRRILSAILRFLTVQQGDDGPGQ